MAIRMKIDNVRLSFPELFEPRTDDNDRSTYEATFLIPKDHPQIGKVKDAIRKIRDEEWPDKVKRKRVEICLRDGEEREHLDGYDATVWSIGARRPAKKGRPTVLDADRSPLVAEDGRPYAGCYVNAIIEFYAFHPEKSKSADARKSPPRVCASLEAVQFFRDGESFGGGTRATADDFDDVTGEAGEFEELDEEEEEFDPLS